MNDVDEKQRLLEHSELQLLWFVMSGMFWLVMIIVLVSPVNRGLSSAVVWLS